MRTTMTVALSLLLLLGCDDDRPADGEEGAPCQSRDECNPGLWCLDGICQQGETTDGDADVDSDADSDGDGDGDGDGDSDGDSCASGVTCGSPAVCCDVGEQCHEPTGSCAPSCPAPRELCGAPLVCCSEGDLCFSGACTTPGEDCLDFADCDDDEYCEPTLGTCLPIDALPDCEYRPPTGVFSPIVEWTFDPETPPYSRQMGMTAFSDICATGEPVVFTDDDEATATLSLPRRFPFFGIGRDEVVLSTNGWLSFDPAAAANPAPANPTMPDPTAPNGVVAAYWDDLRNVSVCVLDDAAAGRFVVQWAGTVATSGEAIAFQAVLWDNGSARAGDMELIYGALGAVHDGDGATIGVESDDGSTANLHGYDRSGSASTDSSIELRALELGNMFDALAPPAVFDLDFDGRPEVILVAYDDNVSYDIPNGTPSSYWSGVLVILNGEDGTVQARHDGGTYLAGGCAPSVGDIDGDGEVEIVAIHDSGPRIAVFNADAELEFLAPDPIVRTSYNGWGGGVHIADLNADGSPEMIYGLDVFDSSGTFLWSHDGVADGMRWPRHGVVATPSIGDLDADGELEVVAGATAWNADGTNLWDLRPTWSAMMFSGIADFDGDALPEVVLIGAAQLLVVSGVDGTIVWGPAPIDEDGGPPNIGDFDNDGQPEIGTAGSVAYYVYDLECSDPAAPCESEWVRWSSRTKDNSSRVTGSSLFDFEGDGVAEVVYSDECWTRVYRGDDGTILFETPVNTRTATEYPLVVDVDGDNNAEIVIVANEPVWNCASWNDGHGTSPEDPPTWTSPDYGTGYRGLIVYGDAWDNWVRTRRIWSGHAYHISNINSDGTIPVVEEPSWTSHNTWRMNAQGEGLFLAPDLVGELAVDDTFCAGQSVMTLLATVSNVGALGVSAGVSVSFYRSDEAGGWTFLGTARTSEDLLPGASTEVRFEYRMDEGEAGVDIDFRVVVDWDEDSGRGGNNECDEENNEGLETGRCDVIG